MKKLAVLLVVAAAGFAGYQLHRARPAAQYEAFAELMLQQRYDLAAKMTDGLMEKQLEAKSLQARIGGGPAMFQKLFPSRFAIESEEKAPDGTLTLKVLHTVLFNPVGVESAVRPAMYATVHETIEMRKVAGAWKVASFEPAVEKWDTLSQR